MVVEVGTENFVQMSLKRFLTRILICSNTKVDAKGKVASDEIYDECKIGTLRTLK